MIPLGPTTAFPRSLTMDQEAVPGLPQPELRELVEQCVARYPTDGMRAVDELSAQYPRQASALRRRVAILERSGLLAPERAEQNYPEQLGDFRLLELIGEGGMGAVFRAQQQSLGRLVALKVIRAEQAYSPRARERFRREIEAIAAMRSSGIVQVYTVGDEHGVPFYAMELVDGINLSDLVVELRRVPPERLSGNDIRAAVLRVVQRSEHQSSGSHGTDADELFAGTYVQACCRIALRVARTLAYAHERGVLHRDVKPSNVMLDRGGRVLLLDFGLARAIASEDAALTRTGAVVGSLAYMAPEQMRGDKIDARADVYGVGVTLYELLTHRAAFRGDTQDDLRGKVLAGAAPAPAQINPLIPRDAETICLLAMAPESHRRYPSAQALADDLQRFLELRPIEARRAGAFYRARRWAQRHPAKATAWTAGLLVAAGGPTALAVQERMARGEIQAALEQAERYQKSYEHALQAAVQGMERTTLHLAQDQRLAAGQLDGLRRELLEGAATFWATMASVADPHPSVRPALFRARGLLASTRTELGDIAGARAALDAAVAELAALRSKAPPAELPAIEQQFAKMLCEQATVMAVQKDVPAALTAWQQSIDVASARLALAPNAKAVQRHIQRCRMYIAQTHAETGNAAAAELACREILAALDDTGDPDLLLRARTMYGGVLLHRRDFAAAEPELLAVIEARRALQADNPADAANLRDLKTALHNLGYLYQQRQDIPRARTYLQQAVAVSRELLAAYPERIEHKLRLVATLTVLANVCVRLQDKDAAEQACNAAIALAEPLAQEHADLHEARAGLAEARSTLAQVILDEPGRRGEGVALLQAALAVQQALAGAPDATATDYANLSTTQGLLASALDLTRDRDAALVAEHAAFAALARAADLDPAHASDHNNRARLIAAGLVRAWRAKDAARARALSAMTANDAALEAAVQEQLAVMSAGDFAELARLRAQVEPNKPDPPDR
jgi:serine/threonine protein kinase